MLLFLDSRRYGETAKTLGKLILQDLKSVSAKIDSDIPKVDRQEFSVIIDEFADLAQDDFLSFLDSVVSICSFSSSVEAISDLSVLVFDFMIIFW